MLGDKTRKLMLENESIWLPKTLYGVVDETRLKLGMSKERVLPLCGNQVAPRIERSLRHNSPPQPTRPYKGRHGPMNEAIVNAQTVEGSAEKLQILIEKIDRMIQRVDQLQAKNHDTAGSLTTKNSI